MGNSSKNNVHKAKFVDFDIHGFVGVRLVNPSKADELAVKRQLGPLHVPALNREPDIVIRFEKHLSLRQLNYLGLNNAGYTKDGFFLLKSQKAQAKVRIPFNAIGSRCEIVCETGLRRVPLLTAIVNLTLLKKDCIPLHAAAFVYKDVGILVTGWSKGGKTEALLAFANHGAKYVGDEWVILTKDGQRMYGLPEPITIWDWQIKQLPAIHSRISFSDRLLFKAIHVFDNLHTRFGAGRFKNSFPVRIINKAMPALSRQLHVNIPQEELFDGGLFKLEANPQKLFFVISHNESSIHVERWDPMDIARRMLHSVQYEQIPFFEYYYAFKFAFPHLQNDFLENIQELQADLLHHALRGKEAYRVLHPYPVSLESLFQEMEPFCQSSIEDSPSRVAVGRNR